MRLYLAPVLRRGFLLGASLQLLAPITRYVTALSANSWRTPPSRPCASARSRASACGPRGTRRPCPCWDLSYDHRCGYVARHDDELPTITAFSLQKLLQRIGQHLGVGGAAIRLVLDRHARQERNQQRKGGRGGPQQWR